MAAGDLSREVAVEQAQVDTFYAHLDELRTATEQRRNDAYSAPVAGTPGGQGERDALFTTYQNRLVQLRAVEDRLCFGRLDLDDDTSRYVGRIGLSDDRQVPLLIDWRAPAAEPFYQATAAQPGGVVRRRHITTRGRTVTALDDEVFDLDALDVEKSASLAGEGALMAALGERRSGRMRDIVATIQSEQDQVIRAPLPGILVVQGGPGTGKTAVALHRAAYLLYTHRDRIARSGVLLVGPNLAFLRYIEQVLPSLGETGVLSLTPGELFPGVHTVDEPDLRVAALKGDARMAGVVRAAVRNRQRVPARPVQLKVEGERIPLLPDDVLAARSRARSSGRPHNQAREVFVKDLLQRLARRLAQAMNRQLVEGDDLSEYHAALRDSADVRREVNLCWLPVSPQRLVAELWSDAEQLRAAAEHLTAEERALLRRDIQEPFTAADVPLLDEAAELLGEDDTVARAEAAHAAADRARELEYARGVLEMTAAAHADRAGGWLAGTISADALVDRYGPGGSAQSVAERAQEDRTWTFAHVVVDEAQELSPMMWRLLMRRCPSKSMTVVGDLAQGSSLAGPLSWSSALDPFASGRWSVAELTVNYRTPGLIMTAATRVLESAGIASSPPISAREGRWPPATVEIADYAGPGLVDVVRSEIEAVDGGRLAVITPRALTAPIADALERALGPDAVGRAAEGLEKVVDVLSVDQAKGLEFDTVVVCAPDHVLAGSPRGANDLYVAMTRPTQRLVIVHRGDLPAALGPVTQVD